MTAWVVLYPKGDTVTAVEAIVDGPVMVQREVAEATIRRIALERELAEVRDIEARAAGIVQPTLAPIAYNPEPAPVDPKPDPPVAGLDAGVDGELERRVGADGVVRWERHFTAQVPGPRHVCFCNRAFDDAGYRAHVDRCPEYAAATTARGAGIPGARMWGNTGAPIGPLGGVQ